jgi:hypothetical protein
MPTLTGLRRAGHLKPFTTAEAHLTPGCAQVEWVSSFGDATASPVSLPPELADKLRIRDWHRGCDLTWRRSFQSSLSI